MYLLCLFGVKCQKWAKRYKTLLLLKTQKVVVNLKVGLGFQPTESHIRITGHAPKISQRVPTKDINIHNVDGPYMSFKTSLAKICQYQPICYHQMSSKMVVKYGRV